MNKYYFATEVQSSLKKRVSESEKKIVRLKSNMNIYKEVCNVVYYKIFKVQEHSFGTKTFWLFLLHFVNSMTLKSKANCYWGSALAIEVISVDFSFCYWLLPNEMSNPSVSLKS